MYFNNITYMNDIQRIINKNFEYLKNKTVFITGASGLVGSFLVDTLRYLNKNYDYKITIYATFSSKTSLINRFPDINTEAYFIPIIQDIKSPINLNAEIDYLIHAASNTHPALYAEKPVETIKLNILGTASILDFAQKSSNCKTIFLSTLEVYGEDASIEEFYEEDIGYINFMISRSCYPESKRLCETMCHAYINQYKQNIVIARLGYIYGPTVKLTSSKADVQFLNKALAGKNIILKSPGLQKRSYCYVADTVSALLTILNNGECGQAYNIASKKSNVQLKDFARILANIAGVKVEYGSLGDIEIKGGSQVLNSTLNSNKLSALGWHSVFSLEEGIAHTLAIKRIINERYK